jgi:hypothetical protein
MITIKGKLITSRRIAVENSDIVINICNPFGYKKDLEGYFLLGNAPVPTLHDFVRAKF